MRAEGDLAEVKKSKANLAFGGLGQPIAHPETHQPKQQKGSGGQGGCQPTVIRVMNPRLLNSSSLAFPHAVLLLQDFLSHLGLHPNPSPLPV